MNAHEIIDRVAAKSPRAKILGVIITLVVLAAVIAGLMYAGHLLFNRWADSEYLRQRDVVIAEVAVLKASAARHEQNEVQLAAENDLLKKQNQARVEAEAQVDTQREQKALADQAKRDAERAEKFSEIDADQDYNSQLCATCREYRERGFKLSFCGRCEVNQ